MLPAFPVVGNWMVERKDMRLKVFDDTRSKLLNQKKR
jgi:hypothetical protein